MKTTRIDIEGENGRATLRRDGRMIVIEGQRLKKAIDTGNGRTCLVSESFRLLADIRPTNWTVAVDLQRNLDGYAGTSSMIHDYLRVIETLAD